MLKEIVKPETMERATSVISLSVRAPRMTGRHFAWVEDGRLKGVIGLKRKSWYMTEVCHLAILPEYVADFDRIALAISTEVLKKVETPIAVCTIAKRNERVLRLATGLGFNKVVFFNESVYFLTRTRLNAEMLY